MMRRLDRRGAIRFVDVSTAQDDACPIARADLLARFHASEDGRLLSGGAAFAAMCGARSRRYGPWGWRRGSPSC